MTLSFFRIEFSSGNLIDRQTFYTIADANKFAQSITTSPTWINPNVCVTIKHTLIEVDIITLSKFLEFVYSYSTHVMLFVEDVYPIETLHTNSEIIKLKEERSKWKGVTFYYCHGNPTTNEAYGACIIK